MNTSESHDKTSNTEQSEQEKGARVRERSESQDASSSTDHATRFEAVEIPSTVQFHGKRGLAEELRVRNLRAMIAERQAEKRRVEGEQNDELAEKKRRREIEHSAIVEEIRSVDITEIYSPQRVTNEARRYGLKPGEAMDITTGWDFRNQEDRERALRYVKEEKPLVVIGSPMCRMFSRLQKLSEWNEKKEEQWIEAKEHIRFVVEIYREQLKGWKSIHS